jgi:TfoX/Sxy family transcriptional regulator of competence genes
MTRDNEDLQAVLQAAAPPDLELASRPMFGGIMFYARGMPFALIWQGGLALKLAGADHAEFTAIPGVEPFMPPPDRPPSKSYSTVPEAMLADREALRGWIARAAASAKPAAKSRRTKTR